MPEKQQKMEGIIKTIKEVEDAAEELRQVRGRRMSIQKDEEAAVKKLKELLAKHELKVYHYDIEEGGETVKLDAIVEVKSKEKVYVRVHKEEEEDENETGN